MAESNLSKPPSHDGSKEPTIYSLQIGTETRHVRIYPDGRKEYVTYQPTGEAAPDVTIGACVSVLALSGIVKNSADRTVK